MAARIKDINTFIQVVRRDLINHGFQPAEGLKEKLQSMIAEKIEKGSEAKTEK
ncbi:unnamed protein product [marine sediment metagenome]|uniref:Uncharacterized protein n=1 Tax=marine sediment metagenome TaxID=412755 RepID=X0WBE3_9ZZZZ